MVKLPNGEDYGIAIKFGRYDKCKLDNLLSFIEDNYKGVEWWGGSYPTGFTPDLSYYDEEDEEITDFAIFIERDNELTWGAANYIHDEDREYDYVVYTFDEFCAEDEDDIKNEMDVSFLYGG